MAEGEGAVAGLGVRGEGVRTHTGSSGEGPGDFCIMCSWFSRKISVELNNTFNLSKTLL